MTHWERLKALPQPQRGVASRLLLLSILKRLEDNPQVPEVTLKHMLGFNRGDLLRWHRQLRAARLSGEG
jgi:hypothetical protein